MRAFFAASASATAAGFSLALWAVFRVGLFDEAAVVAGVVGGLATMAWLACLAVELSKKG